MRFFRKSEANYNREIKTLLVSLIQKYQNINLKKEWLYENYGNKLIRLAIFDKDLIKSLLKDTKNTEDNKDRLAKLKVALELGELADEENRISVRLWRIRDEMKGFGYKVSKDILKLIDKYNTLIPERVKEHFVNL